LICVVLGSIWACDSLAYYGGKFFGKHKLFERVSPKKTWEGAVAGFIGGITGVLLVRYLFIQAGETFYLDVLQVSIIGALGGSLGQLGDLAESWLKRDAGVKDSSSIIPGHGGVLDRFDSLLFVAPATYVYVKYFI
jgi:phosphatidate cytidylyltransferase